MMTSNSDLLRGSTLFGLLPEAEIQRVASSLRLERYAAGERVIAEGEKGNSAYIIAAGEAGVVTRDLIGEEVTLRVFNKGEVFGEVALVEDSRRTATVKAIPAPSAALTISLSTFSSAGGVPPKLGVQNAIVPANSTAAVSIPVQGLVPGFESLFASAPGYTGHSLSVQVLPLLSLLSPAAGLPGTVVTVTGAGFVAPVVRFGGTSASITLASSTQLSATVPPGLAAGATPVTVWSNGQTSVPLTFVVPPPPPCPPGTTRCAGTCVDLTNDPMNCGACGAACGAEFPICCAGCWYSFGRPPFCYKWP